MKNEQFVTSGRKNAPDAQFVTLTVPESFEEARQAWGDEDAEKLFAEAVTHAVGRRVKTLVAMGRDTDAVASELADWHPGKRAERAPRTPSTPISRTLSNIAKLSDEELAMLREKLTSDPRFAGGTAGETQTEPEQPVVTEEVASETPRSRRSKNGDVAAA